MADAPSLPKPGDVVGKYRIERVIGQGGMGAVFEATHVKLGQRVAIKMLLPELLAVPELVARFEREARAAARMRHRNAARVTDVDQTERGLPFMVMELLHGHDLEAELEARNPLPIGEAVYFVVQAASAMAEAHELGTVHRDLKPSNLFLDQEADGTSCLKVLDFGISKIVSDDVHVTSTQTQMGTPLYMSPEQVRSAKNVDHRTDVWSLGVILYELLAGKPPFEGNAAGIGAAIVSDTPRSLRELRPEVPEELEAAIARAMEKDPARRFQSMQELVAAFVPFSSVPVAIPSQPRVSSATSTGPRPASPSFVAAATLAATPAHSQTDGTWTKGAPARSRSAIAIALVVAGLSGLALVAWVVSSSSKQPASPTVAATASATSTPLAPSTSGVATSTSESPPIATSAPVIAASSSAPSKPVVATTTTARASASAKPRASASAPANVTNPDRL